ncbi:MAG: beta-propeller fold lactonase family protein [Cyanobacteria bacterium P01_D01_bin.156]
MRMRLVSQKLLLTLVSLMVVFGLSFQVSQVSMAQTEATPQGRYLLALSDVDMVATAYEDGNLGAVVPDTEDTLAIAKLPFGNHDKPDATITASNSVFSPPAVMDVTPNGQLAMVIETWQPRSPGATKLSDLTQGNKLRAFDLTNPDQPQLVSEVDIPKQSQAMQVSPAGDLIAVTGFDLTNGLTFVSIRNNQLGTPQTFQFPELTPRPDLPLDGAIFVQWHPSGRYVAVNFNIRSQVIFYEVVRASDGIVSELRQWGNIVRVNKFPMSGRFTPDGHYYITSDLQWGPDVPGFFNVNQGVLTTVRVAASDAPAEQAQHFTVAVAEGGLASETIAISPNGQFLVVSSMRNTGKLRADPSYDPEASLGLYRINPETGVLSRIGEWRYEATLPQGLAFDTSGNFVFVGVNAYNNDNPMQGGVEIWRLQQGEDVRLERLNTVMRLPRGVHMLSLID